MPVVVPLEDIEVGDTLEFFGLGVGDGIGGFRFGTVTKLYPRLRVIRLERKSSLTGKEVLLWRTAIHETRVLRNLSREAVPLALEVEP